MEIYLKLHSIPVSEHAEALIFAQFELSLVSSSIRKRQHSDTLKEAVHELSAVFCSTGEGEHTSAVTFPVITPLTVVHVSFSVRDNVSTSHVSVVLSLARRPRPESRKPHPQLGEVLQ